MEEIVESWFLTIIKYQPIKLLLITLYFASTLRDLTINL